MVIDLYVIEADCYVDLETHVRSVEPEMQNIVKYCRLLVDGISIAILSICSFGNQGYHA